MAVNQLDCTKIGCTSLAKKTKIANDQNIEQNVK